MKISIITCVLIWNQVKNNEANAWENGEDIEYFVELPDVHQNWSKLIPFPSVVVNWGKERPYLFFSSEAGKMYHDFKDKAIMTIFLLFITITFDKWRIDFIKVISGLFE